MYISINCIWLVRLTELPFGAQVSGTAPSCSKYCMASTAEFVESPEQARSIAFRTCKRQAHCWGLSSLLPPGDAQQRDHTALAAGAKG